jgi:signal peptidase I
MLPAVVLLAVGAYFVGIGIDHADPPVIAVQGHSMQPTLVTGDLVVVEGVNPSTLKVGDVIAVTVPTAARQKYDLPPHVVHRIVKITHTPAGPVFTTKGDNNPSPDVFKTTAVDVIGEVHYTVPDLGFVVLFFGSKEGHIFLGAVGAVVVVYLAIGAWEKRQRSVQGLVETIESLSGEGAGDPETKETLRELVSAVGEYGMHLRSHTAVMMALAESTESLKDVVSRLSGVVRSADERAPVAGVEGTPPERSTTLAMDRWTAAVPPVTSPALPPIWDVQPLPRR